jgi:hypothetical protein
MTSLNVGRSGAIATALILLAGCGGSQPPMGAPGMMPQSHSTAATGDRSGPLVKHGTAGDDLLYVSNLANTYVYTYPGGQGEGMLAGNVGGLCSDAQGNVFTSAVNGSGRSSTIYEYAHGGTSPIDTLSDPGVAFGCAYDATTGNLAVTNQEDFNNGGDDGDVAVYNSETGNPTMYSNQSFFRYDFCGYDGSGNLYVTGETATQKGPKAGLAGLAKGSGSLVQIGLSKTLFLSPEQFYPSVQWDGTHMTVSSLIVNRKDHPVFQVYRLSINGSVAKVVGTTTLRTHSFSFHMGQVAIQGATLLAPYANKGQKIGSWPYPAGGSPTSSISNSAKGYDRLFGLTVSVPASH